MMNSLFDTYVEPLRDQERFERQKEAVLAVLLRGERVYRDEMYDVGLPGVGRIKNVGGRIHDLRKEGHAIDGAKDPARKGYYYFMNTSV
jgi:hypothetical protein